MSTDTDRDPAGHEGSVECDAEPAADLFSFRWHPFAVDPKVDYSGEPTTLVTFELATVPGGTQLTITETGFDGIPAARRAKAFEMNDHGWTMQVDLVEKYVTRAL